MKSKTGGGTGTNQYATKGTSQARNPALAPPRSLVTQMAASGDRISETAGAIDQRYRADAAHGVQPLAKGLKELSALRSVLTAQRDAHVDALGEEVGPGATIPLPGGQRMGIKQGEPRDRFEHDKIWEGIAADAMVSADPEQTVVDQTKTLMAKGSWSAEGLREGIGINPNDFSHVEYGDLHAVITEASGVDDDAQDFSDSVTRSLDPGGKPTARSRAYAVAEIDKVRAHIDGRISEYEKHLIPQLPRKEAVDLEGGGKLQVRVDTSRTGWQHEQIWKKVEDRVKANSPDPTNSSVGSTQRAHSAVAIVRQAVGTPKWKTPALGAAGLGDTHTKIPGKYSATITP